MCMFSYQGGGGGYIMCLVLIYNELLAKHLKTHFLKIEWSNIIDFIQTYENSMNKFESFHSNIPQL